MDKNKSLSFFHVFNRGVDKRKVFMDKTDYYRFMHDLYEFNDTKPTNPNHGRKNNNDGGSTNLHH
ncbi:MAG: hypothetical protein RQ856_05985 [Candidatus Izemoplasmatales bacterium]|nr:hypothetical protein [Candidatus Izemoplasmatales bacterium]